MIFRTYRLRKWKRKLAIVQAKIEAEENTNKRTGKLFPAIAFRLGGELAEASFMVQELEKKS